MTWSAHKMHKFLPICLAKLGHFCCFFNAHIFWETFFAIFFWTEVKLLKINDWEKIVLIISLTVFLTPNDHPHWNAYCKQNHASNHFPFASRCVHFSKSLTVGCSVQYFLFMRGYFLPIPQFFYTNLCNFCVILLK